MKIEKQRRYDRLYYDIAKRVSEMSFCKRLQAGAVLVKDDNIISFGFNGMPSGMPNKCEEDHIDKTREEVLHAEENLFLKLARSAESAIDATIYITHEPCVHCARKIFQVGIKRVVYGKVYEGSSQGNGVPFLKERGLEVEQIGE
jgi:dCMP deaminase